MRRDGKVGIRLRREMFLNGQRRNAGSVIVLKPGTAAKLINSGLGRYTEKQPKKQLSR